MTNRFDSTHNDKPLPLAGLRVVDVGWVWAIPVVGHILADMGAQVIKVESRDRLDMMRQPLPGMNADPDPDSAVGFHILHRGKMGITLNLRPEEGKTLLKRLVAISDVVIENFSPGTMERLGVGFEELKKVNPSLVMLSVSTIGQTGPLSNTPTFSPCAGALSGLETLVGYEGDETLGSGLAFGDPATALHGVFALLAALEHRDRTGEGQHIDASLAETGVSFCAEPLMDYQWNRRIWGPLGNNEPGFAPHNTYPCNGDDTWVAIAIGTEPEWQRVRTMLGNPDWGKDPRFTDQFSRWKNRVKLDELVGQWTALQDRDDLAERLQAAAIAASPAYKQSELFDHEHHKRRNNFVTLDHPKFPAEKVYGLFWQLSTTPGSIRRHAPLLGEHNAEVYENLLGISKQELQRLIESGALR